MKNTINTLQANIKRAGYIADNDLVTNMVLMEHLGRPLLIEGEAGVRNAKYWPTSITAN